MSSKRPRSPSPEGSTLKLYRSQPIEDRSSTFLGVYSPTATAKELASLPEFKDASHRVTAWRKEGKQKTLSAKPLFDSGHDDDGEQYAGKKLENVLWNLGISGSLMVVRWYGGVMLGPVRFTHIEGCAKEAINEWKAEIAEGVKRQKIEEEEEVERKRLIPTLEQRDQSITVLRQLLAEKQQQDNNDSIKDGSTIASSPPRPQTKPNYSTMPLQALRRLEKARDSSISWILKEIDKAEAAEQEQNPSTTGDEVPVSISEASAEKTGDQPANKSTPPPEPSVPVSNAK